MPRFLQDPKILSHRNEVFPLSIYAAHNFTFLKSQTQFVREREKESNTREKESNSREKTHELSNLFCNLRHLC